MDNFLLVPYLTSRGEYSTLSTLWKSKHTSTLSSYRASYNIELLHGIPKFKMYCGINSTVPSPAYSQDPHFDKALQGIENLQKLTSSELEDTASLGRDSELEDEGEDILVAGGLEGALEVHWLHLLSLVPRPHSHSLSLTWEQS